MSGKQMQPYESAIAKAKERFVHLADEKAYERESIFALQAVTKNDYATKVARNNPQSVHLAMINAASTGLTLNPANAYAYLVPRDGAIVLDISYKGLIKIATDTGAILWARADLVYAEDEFVYNGPAAMPEHKSHPFKERGEVVGCYCIAKTKDGDILTEVMDRAEIEKIRSKSSAYARTDKQGKPAPSGPWLEWFEQMTKKAVIKRASKTWPYTQSGRLHEAIEIANEAEGGYNLDGRITPTGGAWQACSEEEQEFLLGIVNRMLELLPDVEGKIEPDEAMEAAKHMQSCNLTADEQVALWTRFNSRQRTALKAAINQINQEAA